MAAFRKNDRWILIYGLMIGASLGVIYLLGRDTGLGFLRLDGRTSVGQVFPGSAAGSPAPDFTLEDINGQRIRLGDYRDQYPVLINFWATWCAPCAEEMPLIQEKYIRYQQELRVLAVNFAEPPGAIREFVDQHGLTFEVLQDPQAEVQNLYKVRGYPTSFFIDKEGVIRAQHIGIMSKSQLEGYLAEIGVGG